MPPNGNPRSGPSGSLRRPDAFKEPSEEQKKEVSEIVENDPALQALLGQPAESLDHLVEEKAEKPGNAWLNEPAAPAGPAAAIAIDKTKVAAASGPWDSPRGESPWGQEKAREPASPPAPPPAPPPQEAPQEAPEAPEEDEKKDVPYECVYYWENDPQTFGAEALLRGAISDVCHLNATLKIRVRALSSGDLMSIDDYLPPLQAGERTEAWMQMARGLIKIAMAITHINGRPLGEVDDRIKLFRQFPEQLVFRLEDVYYEFGQRLHARLRGARELLKN